MKFLAKDIPYAGTKISAAKTKMDIELMLKEFGIVAMRWTDTPDSIKGFELPLLEFIVKTEINGVEKEIGFKIQPPLLKARKRVNGKYGNVVTTSVPEQSMRLLFWYLKSRLEAVKFGLEEIQDAMLSKVMVNLPDGTISTVAETIKTQLSLPNQSNNLLPEFEIKKQEETITI